MNNLHSLNQARDQKLIDERKGAILPRLSRFQKFGASTMTFAGSISDRLNATEEMHDHLSPLRRRAYLDSPAASKARKSWAIIGISAISLTGILAGEGVQRFVNVMADLSACSNESTTAYLEEGESLSTLALNVPHANNTIENVTEVIGYMNPGMIGYNNVNHESDPNIAMPGIYAVPQECDSRA